MALGDSKARDFVKNIAKKLFKEGVPLPKKKKGRSGPKEDGINQLRFKETKFVGQCPKEMIALLNETQAERITNEIITKHEMDYPYFKEYLAYY